MDNNLSDTSTAAARRRSSSRQRRLQSTLDKLLGINSPSNSPRPNIPTSTSDNPTPDRAQNQNQSLQSPVFLESACSPNADSSRSPLPLTANVADSTLIQSSHSTETPTAGDDRVPEHNLNSSIQKDDDHSAVDHANRDKRSSRGHPESCDGNSLSDTEEHDHDPSDHHHPSTRDGVGSPLGQHDPLTKGQAHSQAGSGHLPQRSSDSPGKGSHGEEQVHSLRKDDLSLRDHLHSSTKEDDHPLRGRLQSFKDEIYSPRVRAHSLTTEGRLASLDRDHIHMHSPATRHANPSQHESPLFSPNDGPAASPAPPPYSPMHLSPRSRLVPPISQHHPDSGGEGDMKSVDSEKATHNVKRRQWSDSDSFCEHRNADGSANNSRRASLLADEDANHEPMSREGRRSADLDERPRNGSENHPDQSPGMTSSIYQSPRETNGSRPVSVEERPEIPTLDQASETDVSTKQQSAKVSKPLYRRSGSSEVERQRHSSASAISDQAGGGRSREKHTAAERAGLPVASYGAGPKSAQARKPSPKKKSLYQRPTTSISLMNIGNPTTMRRSAYQDWLKKKEVVLSERRKKELLQREQEKEKLKEKGIKRQNALAAFKCWKKTKDEELSTKLKAQKKNALEKEQEEKHKREEKTKDADKMFQSWKNSKDDTIKSIVRERRKSETTKLEKKKEDERQKRADALKVFEEWKRQKDAEVQSFVRLIKKAQRQQHEEIFANQIERDMEAQKRFEIWLEQKERERVDKAMIAISPSPGSAEASSPDHGRQFGSGTEFRPPWIPSNPTVPKTAKLAPRRHARSRSAGGMGF